MILEHVAIWTNQLEILRDFYVKWMEGQANHKYLNPAKQYESYFITFGSGARLELMSKPDIPANLNDTVSAQHLGIIHLAFELKSKSEVDAKAKIFQEAGFPILDGPRVTGDGYYEFVTLDPDQNRIEITAKNSNN